MRKKSFKLLVLIGTKAQFIKMAPLLLEFEQTKTPYSLVLTGQHSETFEDLERAFGTRNADLILVDAPEASTKYRIFGWTVRFWLAALRPRSIRIWRKHAAIVVHGDTLSTLYGAILGRLFCMDVVHIEAGLRSQKLFDPFPEELIRRVVSKLTSFHFCPDKWSAENLGVEGNRVFDTQGNTLRDALVLALQSAECLDEKCNEDPFAIVSIHRNENLSNNNRLDLLLHTLIEISSIIHLKFVLHPATREVLLRRGWIERLDSIDRIDLIDRSGYFNFIAQVARALFLMTDGGSNQEEASMLGIPCLLLRRTTERQDGLGDTVELSELSPERMVEFAKVHSDHAWKPRPVTGPSPSRLIARTLAQLYSKRKSGYMNTRQG